ncbi:hypothetical protein COJ96_02705 [Bacillus sp. AFS073361]|uniref:hypothetical protein n=1 Tax=Bacillus sp. AFS073361 TaxID=2033511 RepID=UPI000BF4A86B|nr:hypothetical protein [Bacillus sp. AFS073361]PFP30889.1 hypothetical protein COJ96_02705 [Bacillus sp. AFS073361]
MNAQSEKAKAAMAKENSQSDNEEVIAQLEKQVSIAVWIQFIGQIMEAFYLSKIMLVSEEVRENANERQILLGAWIQTAGQLFEGVGTTKQLYTDEEKSLTLEAQRVTNFGDWLQSVGVALEANAGTQIILEEIRKAEEEEFIP